MKIEFCPFDGQRGQPLGSGGMMNCRMLKTAKPRSGANRRGFWIDPPMTLVNHANEAE
jgi:hypothetical protein